MSNYRSRRSKIAARPQAVMFYSKWKCSTPNQILSSHFVEGITEGNRATTFFKKYQYLLSIRYFPRLEKGAIDIHTFSLTEAQNFG
jgi:hypothetical protein